MGPRYDVVVVLGARCGKDGRASNALVRRARHGASLVIQGTAPWMLATGGPTAGPGTVEADRIAEIALELGVPDERILRERRARSTLANATLSKPYLDAIGAQRVLLVTDAAHLPRALLVFRGLGIDAEGAPAPGARRVFLQTLREALAYAYYRFLHRGFAKRRDRAGMH